MNQEEKYDITGMSCAACSARIDKCVRKLDGVNDVNVNLLTNSMVVDYDKSKLNQLDIINSVINAGYGAKLHKEDEQELKDTETPKLLKRLIISLIILIPLFYLGMGFMMNWPLGYLKDNLLLLSIIEFVLSLTIILINHKFFVNGFKAVIHKTPNMDTLVALGSGVAFIYSIIMTIIIIIQVVNHEEHMAIHMTMMNISFETAGMVPTLITIGKTLESFAKGKTTNAIKSLMDLSPKTAIILKEGKEVEIDIKNVQIDDIFVVKPGQSVPVDGVVISGESTIDESMLTGESIPVVKEIDSEIKSGTINQDGVLQARAIRVGNDTTISKIIQAVEKAANSKAKISQIADKISGIFVPIVLAIAIIVFLAWIIFGKSFIDSHSDINSTLLSYSIERAISVLVVSCPCALGLATPVAIMVGSGKGAKNGVLFKNAEAIEESGKVNYIVFDKTGTITNGKPEVTDIICDIDQNEFLSIICSLEKNSNHPLANAITNKGKENNISIKEVSSFKSVSGKGIKGDIDSTTYYVGNHLFIKNNNIDTSKYDEAIHKLSLEGKTPMILSNDKNIIGVIAVKDTIKKDAKEAIDKIKKLGIIPVMLTGDNELTASNIAKEVDIDYVISEVLPEQKDLVINELKKQGKVMMVGDGINDAIALTSADIGLAIGQGSDVAIESADVVLMKTELIDVYAAIRLSKYVYLNIKENLFWAFIYNLIMIPIAAGALTGVGLYKLAPWMGSAAMALSSVFVILNALRINLYNPYKIVKISSKTAQIPDISYIKQLINKQKEIEKMEKVINVTGMMCMHCVAHVKKACESVDGVKNADVDLTSGDVKLTIEKEVSNEALEKAIQDAGYEMKK